MKSLSKEETLRILAMYLNCTVLPSKEFFPNITCLNSERQVIMSPTLLADLHEGLFHSVQFKLILKPLDSISDEQILHLCKSVAPNEFGDFRYSNWKITESKTNGTFQNNKEIRNEKSPYRFEIDLIDGNINLYDKDEAGRSEWTPNIYRDWYLQNYFAVPLYPWGKNAIDLGIAVNINSIPKI